MLGIAVILLQNDKGFVAILISLFNEKKSGFAMLTILLKQGHLVITPTELNQKEKKTCDNILLLCVCLFVIIFLFLNVTW